MSAGGNVSPAAWIEGCLMREYDLLELLSQKETGEVSLWQHRALGRRIILRRCQGEGEVYRRMLGVRQKNLPQVYEAAEGDGALLVLEEYIEGPLLSDRSSSRTHVWASVLPCAPHRLHTCQCSVSSEFSAVNVPEYSCPSAATVSVTFSPQSQTPWRSPSVSQPASVTTVHV